MVIGLALNTALQGLRFPTTQGAAASGQAAAVQQPTAVARSYAGPAAADASFALHSEEVRRKIDKYLQRAAQENGSSMSMKAVLRAYAERVQHLFGEPGQAFDREVEGFFAALEAGAANAALVEGADGMAGGLAGLALGLHALREEADKDIALAADAVNQLMKRLDNVNAATERSRALGQSPQVLQEERDAALRELSEYLDIGVFYDAGGQVCVFSGSGAPLVDGQRHALLYTPLASLEEYVEGLPFAPLVVGTFDHEGEVLGEVRELVGAGVSAKVVSRLKNGRLHGLQKMRDEWLPGTMELLDGFAMQLREEMNRAHNAAAALGVEVMTGSVLVNADEPMDWNGSVRIALLDAAGEAVASAYEGEAGMRALTIAFPSFDSGLGVGKHRLSAVLDEINRYFGVPQAKAALGALAEIGPVSCSAVLEGQWQFDLGLVHEGTMPAQLFVTDVQVLDAAGAQGAHVRMPVAPMAVTDTRSVAVVKGEDVAVLRMADVPAVQPGERVYVQAAGVMPATIGGVQGSRFGGLCEVVSVQGTQLGVRIAEAVLRDEVVDVAQLSVVRAYVSVPAGAVMRTGEYGMFVAGLASGGAPCHVRVSCVLAQADGSAVAGSAVYDVGQGGMHRRYAVREVEGAMRSCLPLSQEPRLKALMVDTAGATLPQGQSVGYVKLMVQQPGSSIVIDSLDSANGGRGFAHRLGLHDLFQGGKAAQFAVAPVVHGQSGRFATGALMESGQGRYAFYAHDPVRMQAMLEAGRVRIASPLGGKAELRAFMGDVVLHAQARAQQAVVEHANACTLYEGFSSRLHRMEGVDIDGELAGSTQYQGAYAGSARLVKVADVLYQALLGVM